MFHYKVTIFWFHLISFPWGQLLDSHHCCHKLPSPVKLSQKFQSLVSNSLSANWDTNS